jgi:hypothetical protein
VKPEKTQRPRRRDDIAQTKPVTTRRDFLQGLAVAAAGRKWSTTCCSRAETPSPAREKLSLFPYSEVKLTGGPLRSQQERIHASYQALDEDRLLKVYRQRAGLPAPGADMGGWYDAEGFGPGQVLGQIISGLSRYYCTTGDVATQAKVKRLVEGFAATIDWEGYCFPCLKSSTAYPCYTLDKIMIGLEDAYNFAGVSSALEALKRCIAGAIRYLPLRAYERFEAPRQANIDESYTLPENLFYAYELTKNNDHRELAKKYLMDRTYFDPLSRGENVLPGLHAYSHVNALCSAARAYLVLGETKYLAAIRNAWEMIEETQSFASGGWAPNEEFVVPNKGLLGESLTKTHAHFETPCGAYAHLKLARYLLRFTGEARYGDGLERVLYNTILGIKDPQGDGHVFYYSDYHPSTHKAYMPDKWPCCSGTTPQVVTDYTISTYLRSEDGIYVNLFTPSELSWKVRGIPTKLIQTTTYPESDSIELRVEVATPSEFTIYMRIPGWLKSPAQLAVNGKTVAVEAAPRTFAALRRRWQTNDSVQIRLPFSFWTQPIDQQHPNTVALMWGPLMLVALDPPLALPKKSIASSPEGLRATPYSPLTFEASREAQKLVFVPFYRVRDEVYTTYVQEQPD